MGRSLRNPSSLGLLMGDTGSPGNPDRTSVLSSCGAPKLIHPSMSQCITHSPISPFPALGLSAGHGSKQQIPSHPKGTQTIPAEPSPSYHICFGFGVGGSCSHTAVHTQTPPQAEQALGAQNKAGIRNKINQNVSQMSFHNHHPGLWCGGERHEWLSLSPPWQEPPLPPSPSPPSCPIPSLPSLPSLLSHPVPPVPLSSLRCPTSSLSCSQNSASSCRLALSSSDRLCRATGCIPGLGPGTGAEPKVLWKTDLCERNTRQRYQL